MKTYMLFIAIPFAVATAPIWLGALALWLLLPYVLRLLAIVLPVAIDFAGWLLLALANTIADIATIGAQLVLELLPHLIDAVLVLLIAVVDALYIATLAIDVAHNALVARLPSAQSACTMIANAFAL